MQYCALGRTELRVSRVIFGAMALSAQGQNAQRRIETIHAAIDAGSTTVDTAPLYEYGGSEELLGRALAGRRGQVQILTKVGLRWDDPFGQLLYRFRDAQGREQAVRRNSRPESIRLEVERSLRRLGVEVLDLVQVHHPDPDTPIADTMGALADLLHAGKLRAIGVSNYSAAQMGQAQRALGPIPLASNQVHYSLLERWPEAEVLPFARTALIGVLAYSPLAQGLLAGGMRVERLAATDMRRHDPRFHRDNLARLSAAIDGALAPVASARNVTVAQVALGFLLSQPGLTSVIVGASSVEQARRNAAAATLALRDDELESIRRAFSALRLDPNAGLGIVRRTRQRLRRIASGVVRRLGRG